MVRLRFLVVAAFVLVIAGCPLLEQQENFIAFTFNGVQYIFTASAATESHPWATDHPYAVGYYWGSNPPYGYLITGSATAQSAQNGTDTIEIYLGANQNYWNVYIDIYDSGGLSTGFTTQIPVGMLDTAMENLVGNTVGEQVKGSLPGVLYEGDGSSTLSNIIFSVERLPNVEEG